MKTLKDFEQELNKCSKCGLCQTSCPLFKINPNECAVSKGKFIMLYGVTKGDLELGKNINKYLDLCLRCGKCDDFCPSEINVCQILTCAKHEYLKKTLSGKIIKFLQSEKIFNIIIKIGSILTKQFRPKNKTVENPSMKVIYFKGCVNQISPNTDKYLNKILKNQDIQIIEPEFDCCGLPFLTEGNLERFEQAVKTNLEKLNTDYDYLVTDCASCESTLLEYNRYTKFPAPQKEKSVNWGNIIAFKDIKFKFKTPVKVTFHKPCHLKNDIFLTKIIKNCENVEYVKMEDYDECCGFAGSFTLKNYNYAIELAKNKAQNIANTQADYVITTCPSCIIGLKAGLKKIKNRKTKVVSLLEFLAKADEIE